MDTYFAHIDKYAYTIYYTIYLFIHSFIHSFIASLMTMLTPQITEQQIVKQLVNNELQRMWEAAVVTNFWYYPFTFWQD
jgi:hypothetical protein